MKRHYFWLVILGLAVTLTGCKNSKSSDETSETATETADETETSSTADDLTTILPSSVDTTLETHLNLARNAVQAWHPDAALTYVSIELPASLALDSGNEVYVFGSAQDTGNWWTYSLSQETGKFVRAIIPKEDFLGAELTPVNLEYWKMNHVEALQLAEDNGGNDFRLANTGTRVTLFLSQRAPRGWLWWSVEYKAPSGESFTLLVNPNRGEVVDENGNELSPSTESAEDATGPAETSL